jgi:hypothetical protein
MEGICIAVATIPAFENTLSVAADAYAPLTDEAHNSTGKITPPAPIQTRRHSGIAAQVIMNEIAPNTLVQAM